jgi:ketol-acid reductoisomerase
MRNPRIPLIDNALSAEGFTVFSDWYSPGKNADEEWQAYAKIKGQTYKQALDSPHAWNVFNFDKHHLDKASTAVLVAPAGKSAHIELGYIRGQGKPAFIYMESEPERYDVMARFATGVCVSFEELVEELKYYEQV